MRIQHREQHTIGAHSGADLSAKTQAYLDGMLQHLQREGKIVLASEIEGPAFIRGKWQNEIIIHWEAETDDPLYQRALRRPLHRHKPFLFLAIATGVLILLLAALLIFKP